MAPKPGSRRRAGADRRGRSAKGAAFVHAWHRVESVAYVSGRVALQMLPGDGGLLNHYSLVPR